MKTIGLIGGMSWQSTAHYYELLNKHTAQKRGGLHSAPILMHSLDFAPIAQLQSDGEWDRMGDLLADSAKRLQDAGAGIIGLATNTMHLVAPKIEDAISVPLCHIADPTIAALREDGFSSVGLLGTRFTLEKPFYKERLEAAGLEVIIPEYNVTNLNGIIFEELVKGIVTERSRDMYVEAINLLGTRGAEAVILGCTEIGMLIDDANSPLPAYDTTELHARALVEMALDQN